MKRYIDAEKLIAEIERRRLSNRYIDTEGYENELLEIITSLQQEQPESGCSEKLNNHKERSEDEKKIASIIRLLKTRFDKDTHDEVGFTRDKMCEYLQSLLLRSHWKPSEEQMDALFAAANEVPFTKEDGNYLFDLYDDLKEL